MALLAVAGRGALSLGFSSCVPLLTRTSFTGTKSVHLKRPKVIKLVTRPARHAWPCSPCVRATATASPAATPTRFSPSYAQTSLRGLLRAYARYAAAEPFITRRLVAAVLFIIIAKLTGIAVPFLFKRVVDGLGTPHIALRAVILAILLHGVTSICASVAHELRNGLFARAGQRVGRRITAESFAHILSLETAFHNASHTGALTRIVDRGTRSVITIFRGLLFAFLPSLFELLLVCGVLVTKFSAVYVFITLITFVSFLAYTFSVNDRMGALRARMNAVENESSAKLTDSFLNVEAVTSFDNISFEISRYDSSLARYEAAAVKNEWLYVSLNMGQHAIYITGLTAVLLLAARGISLGTLTVGSFVMLGSMLQQLWVPLNFLGWQYREVKQSLIDLQNLFQLLQRAPGIKDQPDASPLIVKGGEIEFENVSFTYPQQEDDIMQFIRKPRAAERNQTEKKRTPRALKDVSFKVPPGQSLALVGPSGSGKSSTLRLLYRLYDLSAGRILIDGQDISKVSLSSLRQAISMVPQDTVLFNDTIAYNIRYGKPSASDEEVFAAAKAASIHSTIMRMPQGYDTLVGERGVRLSGGERQRLSVARAFLKGSRIILEDESTSSLDSLMEMEVSAALAKLGMNRTRIIVAHRLSTIQNSEQIVVIQLGRKIEQGTHEELLSIENGVYRDMWRRQQDRRLHADEHTGLDDVQNGDSELRESQDAHEVYASTVHTDDDDFDHPDRLSTPPYPGDARR